MQDSVNMETKINRVYSVQPYVHDKYGLENIELTFTKNLEMPYYSSLFARKKFKDDNDEGTYESYWKVDSGKEWEDSLAYKLIKDSENGLVKIGKRCGMIHNWDTNESYYATDYYLVYYDKNSYFFKPSIKLPISNADNVDTNILLEFLFAFEDSFVLPVYKEVSTGGCFAMSFSDIVEDFINDLNDCGFSNYGDTFFLENENVTIDDDGETIKVYVCSEDGGDTELYFSNDRMGWSDIKRSLCSVRIVDLKEKIK